VFAVTYRGVVNGVDASVVTGTVAASSVAGANSAVGN